MVIRKCDYCGKDTKNEWKNYCCYWCHVLGEKEKTRKEIVPYSEPIIHKMNQKTK